MNLFVVGIYAVFVLSFVWLGVAVEIWAPKNFYRHLSAAASWLLAVSLIAVTLEAQFLYLVMWLLLAAPSFAAAGLVKENSQLAKELDSRQQTS